jgi:hypothetical protein
MFNATPMFNFKDRGTAGQHLRCLTPPVISPS